MFCAVPVLIACARTPFPAHTLQTRAHRSSKEAPQETTARANHLFGEDAHLFANCTSLLPKNRMSSTPREYASGRPLPENHLASTRSRFLPLLFPCAALERFCLQGFILKPRHPSRTLHGNSSSSFRPGADAECRRAGIDIAQHNGTSQRNVVLGRCGEVLWRFS